MSTAVKQTDRKYIKRQWERAFWGGKEGWKVGSKWGEVTLPASYPRKVPWRDPFTVNDKFRYFCRLLFSTKRVKNLLFGTIWYLWFLWYFWYFWCSSSLFYLASSVVNKVGAKYKLWINYILPVLLFTKWVQNKNYEWIISSQFCYLQSGCKI